MKLVKSIFIISLINLTLIISILVYFSFRSRPTLVSPPQVTTVSPTKTPTPDTRCIITVDGTRYDVSIFRRLHRGGDVFSCGGDMSQVFHSQHRKFYLTLMARYKI